MGGACLQPYLGAGGLGRGTNVRNLAFGDDMEGVHLQALGDLKLAQRVCERSIKALPSRSMVGFDLGDGLPLM